MVDVSAEGVPEAPWVARVEAWGQALLEQVGAGEAELSVVVCTDPFIRDLNAQWREKPEATDVLSFPQGEDGTGGSGSGFGLRILGDVVISLETAQRQAAMHGHGVEQEVALLLVHGLLHLLGHDHEEPEEALVMRTEEARLLASLGIEDVGLVGRAAPD